MRHVLARGPEREKGTGPDNLHRLIAAKTGTEARDDTEPWEPMALLHKRKILDLPLMSDNAHPSLITSTLPMGVSVFLNANVPLLLNLPRLILTKTTSVGWNRHKETCRTRTIMWTRTETETDARTRLSILPAEPLLLLSRPMLTIPRTKAEKIECASLSLHLIGKTLRRSRVS